MSAMPNILVRFLMWLDPAVFYAPMLAVQLLLSTLDAILDATFGWTFAGGKTADRENAAKSYDRSAQVISFYSLFRMIFTCLALRCPKSSSAGL